MAANSVVRIVASLDRNRLEQQARERLDDDSRRFRYAAILAMARERSKLHVPVRHPGDFSPADPGPLLTAHSCRMRQNMQSCAPAGIAQN